MKIHLVWCVACLLVMPAMARAQELSAHAEQLLAESVSKDPPADALVELTASDVLALCRQLDAVAGDEDAPQRALLEALARVTGKPARAERRDALIDTLNEALNGFPRVRDKAFVGHLLHQVGTEQVLKRLTPQLHDADACEPAARTLVIMGGEAVLEALRNALRDSEGKCRTRIIRALGELKDTESVEVILPEATASDLHRRLAAWYALARSGDPRALIIRDAAKDGSWLERSRVVDALLILAERLAQREEPKLAAELFEELFTHYRSPSDTYIRCAALRGWADLSFAEVKEVVIDALGDANAQVRETAIEIAASAKDEDITVACASALPEASPTRKASLLKVLQRRGDGSALEAVLKLLNDPDDTVSIGAVEAAAALGGARVVTPLLPLLVSESAARRAAAQQALVNLPPEATAQMLAALPECSAEVQAALLDVLAQRPPTNDLEPLFDAVIDESPAVRQAAWRVFGAWATDQALGRLLQRFVQVGTPTERAEAEKALTQVVLHCEYHDRAAGLIRQRMLGQSPAVRGALLRILGPTGGTFALEAVRGALHDPHPDVWHAALDALLVWPDAEPADTLLEFAQHVDLVEAHAVAVKALLRLALVDAALTTSERIDIVRAALECSRRDEERRLALQQLGEWPDPQTVALARRYLDQPPVAAAAARALVRIANGCIPNQPESARAALDAVLHTQLDQGITRDAQEALQRLERFAGYLTDWWVAGPYTVKNRTGDQIFDTAFAPEEDKAGVDWRPQPITDDPERCWAMNLHATMGGDNRAGYLFTRVYVPAPQPAQLELGSDDGIKAWLNGELVHENNALRGLVPNQDQVSVDLQAGWNTLMLKVTNNGGGWGASARLRTPTGEPIKGLHAQAGEKP